MAQIILQCLSEERRIITSAKTAQDGTANNAAMESKTLLDNFFGELKRNIDEADLKINSIYEQLLELDPKRMKMNIDTRHIAVIQTRQDVSHLIESTVKMADQMVSMVEKELQSWKSRQRLACVGAPWDSSLEQLKTWFNWAADTLNRQLQQLRRLQEVDPQFQLDHCLLDLRTRCEETTRRLLENALVVETQPSLVSSPQRPLILKTGVRFSLKTRYCAVQTGILMKLEQSKVCHTQTPLVVTEELHSITCVMDIQLTDFSFDVQTSTLPLVVISSSNQSSGAWASILWSAMVEDQQPKNQLFLNPPAVAWQDLSKVLSWQFQAMSGRGLDEKQLAMLRDKFVDNHDGLVSWNKFYKCYGPWVWIDGVLDLIKTYLLPLWTAGHIMGFISREAAETLLQDKPMGTFLLRFSESIKEGAITISWGNQLLSDSKGPATVHAVMPYTKEELATTSLADYIRIYHWKGAGSELVSPLLYLYPDIPKDQAFQQYYSKPVKSENGYVNRDPQHVSEILTPPPTPENTSPPVDLTPPSHSVPPSVDLTPPPHSVPPSVDLTPPPHSVPSPADLTPPPHSVPPSVDMAPPSHSMPPSVDMAPPSHSVPSPADLTPPTSDMQPEPMELSEMEALFPTLQPNWNGKDLYGCPLN
ncbi:Signal transducer and activator of transcription 1 [Merluccius polli]|uniref:Signal transducer and activator of transcription n=1 Tax=Merluccius polli TaxID=89951 RepID=A0AA47MVG2_MERPO|nr:Signal transducer and activator of transcription 1 [Merluccius polli]